MRRVLPVLFVLTVAIIACEDRSSQSDPNILVLVIDALRPDHVGNLGYGHDTTPTLDALAARGITFTDNTSPSSYTRASVPSIFTGVFPSVHGVLALGREVTVLSDGFTTLAELLQTRGYATAAFMPNGSLRRPFNFDQGFDLYDDSVLLRAHDGTRWSEYETARKIHRSALEWLDSKPADRFFLYLHYRDVHGPYLPPPPYDEMFWDEDGEHRKLKAREVRAMPSYLKRANDHGVLEYYVSQYDGEIRYTDDRIGEFLTQLEARGSLKNTVIIVTSDHGESFLEHGTWNHGTGLYQEEIHTPLLLVLPGSKLAGSRIASPVQTHDLYPTILDLLHLPKSPDLQGRSLVEPMEGRADADRPVFSEGRFRRRHHALLGSIRIGRWKLIYNQKTEEAELYDLRADPGERRDLAQGEPRRVEELVERLEAFWKRNAQLGPPTAEAPAGLDEETLEALEALGYIR